VKPTVNISMELYQQLRRWYFARMSGDEDEGREAALLERLVKAAEES